jgi:hypothetical protein
MTIETSEQHDAAIERLKELGESPADGPDQDEFLAITSAMVDYETRNRPALEGVEPMAEVKKAIVRCPDDHERAVERVAELGTPAEGSEEEAELFGLIEAIEKWEARHEDEDWA